LHPKKITIVSRVKGVHNNNCSVTVVDTKTSNQAFSTESEERYNLTPCSTKFGYKESMDKREN
jgi:hypothetical protein